MKCVVPTNERAHVVNKIYNKVERVVRASGGVDPSGQVTVSVSAAPGSNPSLTICCISFMGVWLVRRTWDPVVESSSPGARFSKVPESFRPREFSQP